jgi:hypothetical protein
MISAIAKAANLSSALRLKWGAPFVVMTTALALIFVLILYSPNFGSIAGSLLIAPLAVLILIGLTIKVTGRSRLVHFGLICVCAFLSWQLCGHSEAIRSEVRWLVDSRYWKRTVLEEPSAMPSGIKCVVWDGWGMFAQDTDVYLVFSPDDALRNYSESDLSGLPIPVWRVQRLERQWYSVTAYTNGGWDGCGGQSR